MKFLGDRKTLEATGEKLPDLRRLEIPREKSHRPLAKLGMGFSNNHSATDSRNFLEQRLDGFGADVFTAGNDQPPASTVNHKVSIVGEISKVACGKPAIGIHQILPTSPRGERFFGEYRSVDLNFTSFGYSNLAYGKRLPGVKRRGSFQQKLGCANLRRGFSHSIGQVKRNTGPNGAINEDGWNRTASNEDSAKAIQLNAGVKQALKLRRYQ